MSLVAVGIIILLLLIWLMVEALFMPRKGSTASAAVSPDGDDTEDAQMDSAA